ncbi:MAG: hypothetical protein ACE1Z4_03270 [Gammaproteobacteria bacterium]|nr:hypothetical protein [Gammaproteobacteria bacterium]
MVVSILLGVLEAHGILYVTGSERVFSEWQVNGDRLGGLVGREAMR